MIVHIEDQISLSLSLDVDVLEISLSVTTLMSWRLQEIGTTLSLDVDVLVAAEVFGLPVKAPAPCVMNFADEVYGPAKPQPSSPDINDVTVQCTTARTDAGRFNAVGAIRSSSASPPQFWS